MKSMTCKQLGGACDRRFTASSFDELTVQAREHGTEMFQAGDAAHLKAMGEMKSLMENPADMKAWFDARREEFEALPDD